MDRYWGHGEFPAVNALWGMISGGISGGLRPRGQGTCWRAGADSLPWACMWGWAQIGGDGLGLHRPVSSIRWLGAGQAGVRDQLRKGYGPNQEMNRVKLIEVCLRAVVGVRTARTGGERDQLVERGMHERGM